MKDFGCVACRNMKRRCEVVVFVKKDYDVQLETVQKVLLRCYEEKQNNVIYVCRSCQYNLKGLSRENEKSDIKDFAMGVNQVILRECKLERRNRAVPAGVMVLVRHS